MLDLFAGRMGWSMPFLEAGWRVVAFDLILPSIPIPEGVEYVLCDIMTLTAEDLRKYGACFATCSSPCEQFSVHGMKHFHPNPPWPTMGIKLFNHARAMLEELGIGYVMENVRPAQKFVGTAANHAGPFYLWGNAVPALLPHGIIKGNRQGSGGCAKRLSGQELKDYRKQFEALQVGSKSKARKDMTAKWATIPPELANCVANYAFNSELPV